MVPEMSVFKVWVILGSFLQKSTILNFPYFMKLLQLEFCYANLYKKLKLCTVVDVESQNCIKNWPGTLEIGLTLN